MIKITIKRDMNKENALLRIEGHACDYANGGHTPIEGTPEGEQSMLCTTISMMVQLMMYALEEQLGYCLEYEFEEGHVQIIAPHLTERTDFLFSAVTGSIRKLAKIYPTSIEITEEFIAINQARRNILHLEAAKPGKIHVHENRILTGQEQCDVFSRISDEDLGDSADLDLGLTSWFCEGQIWRHYKGDLYLTGHIMSDCTNGSHEYTRMISYYSLRRQSWHIRDYSQWQETVEYGGKTVPRFVLVIPDGPMYDASGLLHGAPRTWR